MHKGLPALAATVCLIYSSTPIAQAPISNLQVRPGQAIRTDALPQIRLPSDIERCIQQGGEDCDGDGVKSYAFGGSDCDDTDPRRYPGNAEVADFDGHDEDCDPQTIGDLDRDGDGFIDDRVFNIGGARGTDCDDTRWFIHPGAAELPNKIDDDCDGVIDNLVGDWWSPAGTPPR